MRSYETTVTDTYQETEDVIFIHLSRPDGFEYEAGQFISVTITRDNTTRHKQYSLYSHPSTDELVLCVKLIEDGFASTYFDNVSVGDVLTVKGPLGQFTFDDEQDHHVFLATGVGIAPIHGLVQEGIKQSADSLSVYHGVRRQENLIDKHRFKTLEDEHSSVSYHPVFSREKGKRTGYVQDHAPINTNAAYYLCGVADFVEDTQAFLRDSSVPQALINRERFT